MGEAVITLRAACCSRRDGVVALATTQIADYGSPRRGGA